VTGSSRGIGAATVIRLAQHGANVGINYFSSADAAERVAEQCRSSGVKAITVKADVSKEEQIKTLFQKVIEELGRVDIVLSNSGIEHFSPIADVTEAQIDQVFDVNVKAQFFVAQQAQKYMENDGRLILMSSISAHKVST
jgi:NAD(P)-dependent dehydrogenase (short-subunit alcohol dehydrogenase family)